ncbi:hypothetical protein KIF59_23045 [Enterobacter cloacae subsp. cloacae]|nr:hypothetical protein [Enterobacter cloacae subsp. cloacae]
MSIFMTTVSILVQRFADDNGAWQFTPTTPLPEGEHHITTTATDEAGNTRSDDFVLVTDYTTSGKQRCTETLRP